jgi:exopolyphosphatase/guanosine-5'-triphosphate,3'-diphosphate pyrophosphatase
LLAALDLGSNNCRLLIARPDGDSFRVVDSFSRIVRLGEGVALTGLLAPEAIDRTIEAMKVCAILIKRSGVRRMGIIATEACRRARNADVLVARVKKEAGLDLKIISEEEEARLAAIGCAPLMSADYAGALVFDIGGGSTEMIWMKRDGGASRIIHSASLPVGVVSLSEKFGESAAVYTALRAEVDARVAAVRAAMDHKGIFDPLQHHLLGTSGTVTTLAAIALGLPRYVRSKVDATWHDTSDILSVVNRLAALDISGRSALGPIGPERAGLVLPGCAIFAAIAANWPCGRLRVADRGLREGILRDLSSR